jgi:hypothetical protein
MTLEKQVGLPEVEIARLRQALQLLSGNKGGNGRRVMDRSERKRRPLSPEAIANTRVVKTRRPQIVCRNFVYALPMARGMRLARLLSDQSEDFVPLRFFLQGKQCGMVYF